VALDSRMPKNILANEMKAIRPIKMIVKKYELTAKSSKLLAQYSNC
jgi:hypothetical protein